jgi:hypothetical protein
MKNKYVVLTESGEVVYGADGVSSQKDAVATANEMAQSDYGKMTIYKLEPFCVVSKRSPQAKIIKK